jgi:hypothetical protein
MTIRSRTSLIAFSALAGIAVSARAHDPGSHHHAPAIEITHEERYRPTADPDRVILTWTGDPRTTQTVTWRTSTDIAAGLAEIAAAGHGPLFVENALRLEATTSSFRSDLSVCHMHRVEFSELSPGTVYAYRVGDGINWSEWFQFRTEPEAPEAFSFVYFGDSQNNVRSMWSRVTREAFRDAPRAAFFLHAGDLVNRADSDGEWGEWFEAGAFINATIPVIATPGNHEMVKVPQPDGSTRRALTEHFPAIFAYPENGPPGLESTVYYVDYGDLRMISLNSNEQHVLQAEWLDRVLTQNERRWTAITFHHPIFSMGRDRDNKDLRELWKPIFDRHAVDIVLNGHDHTYGRSDLVAVGEGLGEVANAPGGSPPRFESGTIYVVSVSGPKMYIAKPEVGVDLVRRAEDTQLYQVITIDGDELRYVARTAIGDTYDAFTLLKRDGRPNELIEGTVEMPPRRR